jgi:hypothetical protein
MKQKIKSSSTKCKRLHFNLQCFYIYVNQLTMAQQR